MKKDKGLVVRQNGKMWSVPIGFDDTLSAEILLPYLASPEAVEYLIACISYSTREYATHAYNQARKHLPKDE